MMMKWRWKCIVIVCVKEMCEKKIDWKWIMDECIEWGWIKWKNRMLMKKRVWLNWIWIMKRSYGMGLDNDYEDDKGD